MSRTSELSGQGPESEKPRQPVPTPWSIIGIVAIGAPLIAGVLAALASRAPKARAMLQPNW